MNTNNIYYGIVHVSADVKKQRNYYDNKITTIISSVEFKPVLVLIKRSITGKTIIKDLNTREKYTTKIPLKKGKLFIKMEQIVAFNLVEENIPVKLPKKDVLKIGNQSLEEIRKVWLEGMEQIKSQKQKVK